MISCVQLFVNSWNVLGMPIICSISSKKLIHWYFRGGGLLVGGNHIRDREYWSSLSSRRILSYRSCRAKTMPISTTTRWKYGEWINTQSMFGPQNEFLFFEISRHTILRSKTVSKLWWPNPSQNSFHILTSKRAAEGIFCSKLHFLDIRTNQYVQKWGCSNGREDDLISRPAMHNYKERHSFPSSEKMKLKIVVSKLHKISNLCRNFSFKKSNLLSSFLHNCSHRNSYTDR